MAATTQRRLRRAGAQPADGLADHEIMARHALERLDGAVSRGWVGEKTHPDIPYITNLRLDPFERTGWPNNGTKEGAQQYFDWFKFQFWRFVFVQQVVGNELQTFLNFPPMQKGASFNLDAVKAEMEKRMSEAAGRPPAGARHISYLVVPEPCE